MGVLGAAGTAPLGAQSGVVIGSGEELLHLLDNNGEVAVDFNVDDVGSRQVIRIGRADPSGTNEMWIDLELIDSSSTLDAHDRSVLVDSLSANITLGSGSLFHPGSDGDLILEDGLGFTWLSLDGSLGNINQFADNFGTQTDFDTNGAVKAWAIINVDGTVARCWRCSTSAADTSRLDAGMYEVDFTIGAINNRPVLATVACPEPVFPPGANSQCLRLGQISLAPRLNDASTFHVWINWVSPGGDFFAVDASFTIIVF